MKDKLPHNHEVHEHLDQIIAVLEDSGHFEIITELFKHLADMTRLRIFWFLCHYEECVVNIAAVMDMSSPAVSHHLKLLKEHELITSRREGKEVYYRASDLPKTRLLHQMIELLMDMACPELDPLPEYLDHSAHSAGLYTDVSGEVFEPEKTCACHCQEPEGTDYHSQQLHIIHEIHELLTVHMDQHWTVETLAKKYLINPTTLKALFKEEYGNSIAAHIREHRMQKAASLILEGCMPLGEVAGTVGYSSQSKFTRAFKAYYHMLPREYRQQHVSH